MTVYTRQIETAIRLIKAKGAEVTWRSIPDGVAADPNKPWEVTGAAPVDHTVSIVFLPLTRLNMEFMRLLAGTEIQIGDFYGLMASVDFTPAPTDVVIDGTGMVCRISAIDVLKPDGTPILYTIVFKL